MNRYTPSIALLDVKIYNADDMIDIECKFQTDDNLYFYSSPVIQAR